MAHLRIEFSSNLERDVDVQDFCAQARRCLIETGLYPAAGLRVRAYCADAVEIGDGDPDFAFADLTYRIGPGRSDAEKALTVERLYATLEDWLKPQIKRPFALSLELSEINYPYAEKRFNTIRAALAEKETSHV